MVIVHLTNHVLEIGNGIVNVAVDLACTQSNLGHQVFFLSSGGEYESLLAEHNVIHVPIVFKKSLIRLPDMIFSFRRIVKTIQPDIIHAHMMTGALIAKIARLNFHYKLVTHIHNEFQKSARVMSVGDTVIAVSDSVCNSMIKRGINKNKIVVIHNGTLHSPRVHPTEPIFLQHPALVTVAGLYERKGIRDLIYAFNMLSHDITAHLYIVGGGPDKGIFEKLAKDSSRNSFIHFEGFKGQPSSYYQNADIFILASHKDPFPLVLLEAREYGCAIIATNVDGIPEALDYGKSGLLVPTRNPNSLKDSIEYLLLNQTERYNLSCRAQENLTVFTVERMTDDVIDIYTRLLS
ncbi:glycosyltransferase family 4 protein [Acidithiobacillus thiooxidans]|uniref:N, N'-diacetylbacillosaminyl-diphospho-undecaprenol alpha-1,3-N-acetylgalactosaminyltransferase n=1 Tax=Acidithiobacillus thiooxidans ATCC 19377 TaxID=637390 RepID=A0A543Q4D4_ACITH|nr:glycosyltransferase family 4 protein [Acidithiobacillus thiooxidans]MDX5934682.1 glycosyltransferase family 4 protein [Acidithiobacillus thiooxidans]TQN51195.1 N,N'-diacetylbacillosaminyl-diphospho-undecaprenol alpha-1,3-N-acetylgalactosaminyltransferase [Acidithiobacillus thiooxidans ATCC 19377]